MANDNDNVVGFKPRAVKLNEEVVKLLEKLLGEARKGDIQELAYIAIKRDDFDCGSTETEDCTSMLGAVALLQYRLARHMNDKDDE